MYQWLGLLVASSYPAALYIFSKTRGDRDDPTVLKQRLSVITVYTLGLILALRLWQYEWYKGIGFAFCFTDCFKSLSLTLIPYIGTILSQDLDLDVLNLTGVRNLLIGPLTEEIVYRGILCALYRQKGASLGTTVCITPLYFGVAHLHHAQQLRARGIPWPQVLVNCGVHFVITWLFGIYAAFLWWHYESVWPAIVAHTFCNWMGAPSVGGNSIYTVITVLGLATFGVVIHQMG